MAKRPVHAGYVVLQQVRDDEWRVVGEVDRHPASPPAGRGRARSRTRPAAKRNSARSFAVVPRSEWRNALDS